MTREEKVALVEELSKKIAETPYFYITDASTMSVADTNKFRAACFEKGIEYKVIKNNLVKKALENQDADFTEFSEKVLKGFSGIMFSPEVSNLPAKVLKDFRKANSQLDKPILKGASIDADFFYGDDQIDPLSKLKSKLELIGEVINIFQSPANNVVSALQSGGHKLSGILETLANKEESSSAE